MFLFNRLFLQLSIFLILPAQALGPWVLRNPFGGQGYYQSIMLGENTVVSTFEGLVRIDNAGRWTRYTGAINDSADPYIPYSHHLCASGDTGFAMSYNGSRVYRTLDSGFTWKVILDKPPFESVNHWVCNDGMFHVRTADAILRYTPGDTGWKLLVKRSNRVLSSSYLVAYFKGNTFFLEDDSLFHLPDGDTLQKRRLPYGNLSQFTSTRKEQFLLDGRKVLRFNASARTWTLVDSALAEAEQIAAHGEYLYVRIGDGIKRTRDGGKTWQSQAIARKFTNFGASLSSVTDSAYVLRHYDGLYRSQSFLAEPVQLLTSPGIFANRMAASGRDIITYDLNGVSFRSNDRGATWAPMGLTGYKVRAAAANDKGFFTTQSTDGVQRSLDGGRTWTRIFLPDAGGTPGAQGLAVHGDTVLVTNYKYLFRSFDSGNSWAADSGLAPSASDHQMFFDGRHLVAWDKDKVCASPDLGETWTCQTGILNVEVGRLFEVAAASSLGHLFLAYGTTFLRSDDGGKSWSPAPKPATTISTLLATPEALVAGSQYGEPRGIFISQDGGDTWTVHDQGLVSKTVTLAVLSQDDLVLRTTQGAYFSADLQGIVGIASKRQPAVQAAPKSAVRTDALGRRMRRVPAGRDLLLPR